MLEFAQKAGANSNLFALELVPEWRHFGIWQAKFNLEARGTGL